MSGDAHVRICESLGVRFPWATRLVVSLSGKQMYMWRAVDGEGEVLEILVQPRRDKAAAMRLGKRTVSHSLQALKKQGRVRIRGGQCMLPKARSKRASAQ
jgi:transposase-like protein